MGKNRSNPIAVIECKEEIPCDPCVRACPHHAIQIEGGIHNIPQLIVNRCVGCGICVAKCSGQAIFVVEKRREKGYVSFPYEMLPLPQKGDHVFGTDRDGNVQCDGIIQKIITAKSFDHTAVVTIEIPVEFVDDIRGFRFKEGTLDG